jgi:hypothetical protein
MRIRENLGGLVSNNGRKISSSSSGKAQVGKVYGVITIENTPTKELFEKYGGWGGVGTIFYLDYDSIKNTPTADLNSCKVAKPLQGNSQKYPLVGELVNIIDAPSAISQVNNLSFSKYYTDVINVWNNPQQNSLDETPLGLGKTFIENADVRNLIAFEGDNILQGRKGNGIRFGSTVKYYANINEWSSIGNDGDPITILANGYITTDNKNNIPNIEEINKEMSSIYMTSTQKIPLIPNRKDTLNPITQPTLPESYINGSQIILNSDRITLNSKKDEVMIFASSNIEISTNNIINLNSNSYTHINSPTIFLGTKNNTPPDEPVLLGRTTVLLLNRLMDILCRLGNSLSSTVAPPPGSPIMEVNTAGTLLTNDINVIRKDLEKLLSKTTFTA